MKKLVTERDIETGAQNDAFNVESHMILTPSARDYASLHGVRLVYPEGQHSNANESSMDKAIREAVIAEFGRADNRVMKAVRDGVASGSNPTPPAAQTDREVIRSIRQSDSKNRVVLAAIGENRTGILGRLTGAISNLGCDIKNVSQTIVSGYFTMILIVEIDSLQAQGKTFEQFRTAILAEIEALDLKAMVIHEDVLKAMHRV